ncbi:MAG: hypothetical protein QHH75_11940 [Bacillota bacterium]|nr:hypothetical protein [Bacillota bacterium]
MDIPITVGNKVTLELKESLKNKKVKIKRGTVVGVYEKHFTLKTGRYRECFLWADVANELIKIKVC